MITCTHLLITWTPNNSNLSRVPVKVWIIGSQLHLMKRKLWISFSQETYSADCCSLRESFSFLLSISFPDPNGTQRKGTVFITGTVDSVIHARAQLIVRKRPFTKCMPIIDIYNCNALPMNFQWNPLLLPPLCHKIVVIVKSFLKLQNDRLSIFLRPKKGQKYQGGSPLQKY